MKLTLTRAVIAALAAGSLAFSAVAAPASVNTSLIRQVEQLIDTISPKDKVQLRALTVKLANLHYAEALRISAEEDITDSTNQRALAKHQKAAVRQYEKFVSGDGGRFDPPHGEQLETARLQLSHMYADLGRTGDAQKIWRNLVLKDEYPAIMSEAALSLAETHEAEDAASDEALKLYSTVVKTNKKHDTIQYANYRTAWILRNQGNFEEAVKALRSCLYDSNGVVKEEVIGDMIVFYSLSAIEDEKAIAEIRTFSEKLQKPELMKQLADAYIAAGNKIAAVNVLKKVTVADANSVHSVRLLEESYGLRDWDTFDATLDRLSEALQSSGAGDELKKEAHVVLKRLAIQLDAERVTAPDQTPKFTAVVDLFATLFPKDEIIEKMVSGAVLAESDKGARIKRINAILADSTLAVSDKQKLVLREQLVHLYQEAGDHSAAASQSGILAASTTDSKDRRRFRFVQASELYDQEKADEALTIFRSLIAEHSLDDIGRKSQLLATRHLGRSKKYDEALAMTTPWIERARNDKEAAESKEFREIAELHEKIVFENAAEKTDDLKSLATFLQYCREGKFTPTSCTNAESLAVKMKQYDDLLGLLAFQKRTDDMLAVLEASGRFTALAEAHEKNLSASPTVQQIMKVVLYREIAGDLDERNQLLSALIRSSGKHGFGSDAEEALVFTTLYDAGMLNKSTLGLKWNETNRCYIVNALAEAGDNSRQVTGQLLDCKTSPGKAWDEIVLGKVENLDQKARKISFYGNNSKRRFEKRVAAINAALKEIDKFLPAADHAGYIKLAGIAAAALNDFAIEIETTPLPEEATEDMIPEITAALSEMARPFREKADGYQNLIDTENKKFAEAGAPARQTPPARPVPLAKSDIAAYLKQMHNNPDNPQALRGLLALFEANGHKRPAAYIQGRLSILKPDSDKTASH